MIVNHCEKVCETSDFVGMCAKEKSAFALIVRAGGTSAIVPVQADSADENGWEHSVEFD